MASEVINKYNIKIGFARYVNENGGKFRPLLIYNNVGINRVIIWRITSKYLSKSNYINHYYFPLFHWMDYGLKKPSFINTKNPLILTSQRYESLSISNQPIVSSLTYHDQIQFIEFLNRLKL